MTNIFKKILDELPKSKIEMIADEEKDQKIAAQMSKIINWKVVESRSDQHPEYSYPMGQILCRDLKEAEDLLRETEYTDCFIRDY